MDINQNEKMAKLGAFCRKVINGELKLIPELSGEEFEIYKSSFVMQQGKYIGKRMINGNEFILDFDIDKNKNILWDMIFLSEVIVSQIDDIRFFDELDRKMKNVNIFGEGYNNDILNKEDEEKLKRSVVVSQKTRDSLSHNNDGVCIIDDENQVIKINNQYSNNRMNCEIPFQYIEKFGNGIIPLNEHKNIANYVDDITSNIYFKMGFELDEIPNFLYRAHPSRIKSLLDESNGNFDVLFRLPSRLFTCDDEHFDYLIEKADGNLDKLVNLSDGLFTVSIDKWNEKFENLLKKANGDLGLVAKLPFRVFISNDNRLEYLLEKVNGDLGRVTKLPFILFFCEEERVEFFLERANNKLEILSSLSCDILNCDLKKLDFLLEKVEGDIEKLLLISKKVLYSEDTKISILEYLLEKVNNNLESLLELPDEIFFCEKERLEYLIKKLNGKIENLVKLSDSIIWGEINTLEYLLEKLNIDLIELSNLNLPNELFNCTKNEVNYFLEKVNGDIKNLIGLPDDLFWCDDDELEYFFKKANGDIKNLIGLSGQIFWCEEERLEYLLKKVSGDIKKLIGLPDEIFRCKKERLEYLLEKVNGDLNKLVNLPDKLFKFSDLEINRLEYLLEKTNGNLNHILESNHSLFFCEEERLEYLIKKVNGDINSLLRLPREIFFCSEFDLEYLLKLIDGDLNKLVGINIHNEAFYCSVSRFEKLLKNENYNLKKVFELPFELFWCDDEVVDSLYELHKENMVKSLFGMGNEKVIALILYMNSVFSNYNENTECKKLDVSSMNMSVLPSSIKNLSSSLERNVSKLKSDVDSVNNFSIKPNIMATYKSFPSVLVPIERDEKKIEEQVISINREFIRLLRNCSVHTMRIFEKDNDTVILEDYTNDINGNKKVSFSAEVSIKDLFDITDYLQNISVNGNKLTAKEISNKLNLIDENKSIVDEITEIKNVFEKNKLNMELKLLIQICLEFDGMNSISEFIQDGVVYFKYLDYENNNIIKSFDEILKYYMTDKFEIFNSAFMEYVFLMSDNCPTEIEKIGSFIERKR